MGTSKNPIYRKNVLLVSLALTLTGHISARRLLTDTNSGTCQDGVPFVILPGKCTKCSKDCDLAAFTVSNSEACAHLCLNYKGCKTAVFHKANSYCKLKKIAYYEDELNLADTSVDLSDAIIICSEAPNDSAPTECKEGPHGEATASPIGSIQARAWSASTSTSVDNSVSKTEESMSESCECMIMPETLKPGWNCTATQPSSPAMCMGSPNADNSELHNSTYMLGASMQNCTCMPDPLDSDKAAWNCLPPPAAPIKCAGGPYNMTKPTASELGSMMLYHKDANETEDCLCIANHDDKTASWSCWPHIDQFCDGTPLDAMANATYMAGSMVQISRNASMPEESEECSCTANPKEMVADWKCGAISNVTACDTKDGCKATYDVCGGELYTGSTRCCSDTDHCVLQHKYYAQCLPRSQPVAAQWNGTVLTSCGLEWMIADME